MHGEIALLQNRRVMHIMAGRRERDSSHGKIPIAYPSLPQPSFRRQTSEEYERRFPYVTELANEIGKRTFVRGRSFDIVVLFEAG